MRAPLLLACLGALGLGAPALGCARPSPSQSAGSDDAGPDPAVGHAGPIGLSTATARSDAAAASFEEAKAPPTEEEAAPTPMPRFVPIVPNPSLKSKLPCPPGTTLSALDTSLHCRLIHPKNSFRAGEGPALSFHANGKLRSQGQDADGQETGHWWFFGDDGALDYEVDYVEGEYDGLYVSYFPNGTRRVEHHEKRGKLDGVARTWDEHGALSTWSLYEGGRLVRTKYFR